MTKGKSYLLCMAFIMVVFLSVFVIVTVKNLDVAHIPVGVCVAAFCSITGGYIGFQVANNGVKGHFWEQEMYDSENPKAEEGKK